MAHDLRFSSQTDDKRKEQRLLVTYRRADGAVYVTREGIGQTIAAALADADAQLRPGRWTRLTVSSATRIANELDLRPLAPSTRSALRRQFGEGVEIEAKRL